MRIAVIQASSQKEKNKLLFECVRKSVEKTDDKVINFGVFENEQDTYSYIETAVEISLLLESGAVDFVVSGCSSGQGMMLACNSLPGILCGYVENPSDAFLFGRINNGNAVSFPLGLQFGWAGEINLQCTLNELFGTAFGTGYPLKDAERKMADTEKLKQLNGITKKKMTEIFSQLDQDMIKKILKRKFLSDYIFENGTNQELIQMLKAAI